MKFANESEQSEAVRLSAGERHTRIIKGVVFTDEAILWLAESQWNLADRNPHQFAGFPTWQDLPDHVKGIWILKAQQWLQTVMDKTKTLSQEIDSISGQGTLGRKCSKCGGTMAHYRLKGYQCMNPSCPGPYGGGS